MTHHLDFLISSSIYIVYTTVYESLLLKMVLLPILVLHLSLLKLIVLQASLSLAAVDPTRGFTPVHLDNSNFVVQKPYDVPVNQRYSFINGVHKLWVHSTDKPHTPSSHTLPRTEIQITVRYYHFML